MITPTDEKTQNPAPPQEAGSQSHPPPNYPPPYALPPGQPGVSSQQQAPGQQIQKSDAQIGEEYRAGLFARCAQGIHEPTTKYGICGIITAVLCFPIGLICLFMDTEEKCARCGIRLDTK